MKSELWSFIPFRNDKWG